jgi:uncharacterized protein YecE (DUF72 family)
LSYRGWRDEFIVIGISEAVDRLPSMVDNAAHTYVGTAGWKKPQWRGDFYPRGLVQRRELEYASEKLTTLEINSTFHGLQRPSTFASWEAETPDDFVFAVKGPKVVTHTAHLRNARTNLADFFASGVLGLGHKLGPLLWQLPPELQFQVDEIERFLEVLPYSVEDAAALAAQSSAIEWSANEPTNRTLRHAVEVRNPSFLNTEFVDLLRDRSIAVVFTNSPGVPGFRDLTSDFVYLRLGSGDDHYADGYDDPTLDTWAERIAEWTTGAPPRDVFAYFKNPAGVLAHTPHNATRLIERLTK